MKHDRHRGLTIWDLALTLALVLCAIGLLLLLPACDWFPKPEPPTPYLCTPPEARAAAREGRIAGTMRGAIENEWIVVLRSTGASSRFRARVGVRELGGRFLLLRGSEKAAKDALRDLDVLYVSPNKRIGIPKPVEPTIPMSASSIGSWGIDRSDQRDLPLDGKFEPYGTGEGIRVYVVDTGVMPGHPDLQGRVVEGYSAVGGSSADDNGHGTHVAGTIASLTYGIGKKILIVPVRVLINGSGSDADVIEGIQWATADAKAHGQNGVGNMSLGGEATDALDEAVCESSRQGFTWAVAAGNDDADACGGSPARTDAALTVGATSDNDRRASFSSFGKCVDLFAPGENIRSLDRTNGSTVMSGTSMATPHVTAAAALYIAAHPGASAKEVHDGVVAMATPGKVTDPGADSPNRLLFVGKEGAGGALYPELLLHQCSNSDPRWCLPDGTPVDHAGHIGCCLGNPEVAWDGWPLVSTEIVDWSRQTGRSTFWHRRPGPFIASDEYWDLGGRVRPTSGPSARDLTATKRWATAGIGGPYVEVGGKADLSRFNEAFFAYNDQVLEHVCSVGGHVEDDVDDGWRRKGGCPYSPWNKDRNLQGEDHCRFVPGDPVADAWIAKWVKHSGRYGCVTYQLSNESRGAGTAEEVRAYEQWEAERIRYWETTYGYPRHPILTNSGMADIAAASWVDGSNWHSIQYAPVAGKVTACNEVNPAPLGYPREYCAAQAGGAYLWLWRAELPMERWKADLAAVAQARAEGCESANPCPKPLAPGASVYLNNKAYGHGFDSTVRVKGDPEFCRLIHGEPLNDCHLEGWPQRVQCEMELMGGCPIWQCRTSSHPDPHRCLQVQDPVCSCDHWGTAGGAQDDPHTPEYEGQPVECGAQRVDGFPAAGFYTVARGQGDVRACKPDGTGCGPWRFFDRSVP